MSLFCSPFKEYFCWIKILRIQFFLSSFQCYSVTFWSPSFQWEDNCLCVFSLMYLCSHFSLVAFKGFSSSLVFSSLIIMYLLVLLIVFSLVGGSLSFLNWQVNVFNAFKKISITVCLFFEHFFLVLSLLSSESWIGLKLDYLTLSHRSLGLCSCF